MFRTMLLTSRGITEKIKLLSVFVSQRVIKSFNNNRGTESAFNDRA